MERFQAWGGVAGRRMGGGAPAPGALSVGTALWQPHLKTLSTFLLIIQEQRQFMCGSITFTFLPSSKVTRETLACFLALHRAEHVIGLGSDKREDGKPSSLGY